jgi:hypothetical protein
MSFAWSYSRLKNFETCPKRSWHYDIAKDVKEPETAQLAEGGAAHKALENRIRHNTKLPLPYLHYEPMMARLAALPGQIYPEQRLALTKDFKPTPFFGGTAWFRTVIDFCNIRDKLAAVIDYKTGKITSDMTQLQLMSATILHTDPGVERVKAALVFVNNNHAERAEFVRGDIPEIWGEILPRVNKLEAAIDAQEFPPKPGGLCKRYCAVVSCPYHGRGTH